MPPLLFSAQIFFFIRIPSPFEINCRHTLCSGDAYSTLQENITAASNLAVPALLIASAEPMPLQQMIALLDMSDCIQSIGEQ